ncbi:MAG: redox-sensing transcriptional repressor Rex [FCB group bacterium]|nr:redox-sensing transcriptional repressor Rex [FCB group bacterium]
MKNIFDFSPSPITLKRLAEYLCHLIQLPADKFSQISSAQLSEMMATKPSQLRQDFHHFGGFGQPGHPYDLQYLIDELKKIFGVDNQVNLLLFGATCMSTVLLEYPTLKELNFNVSGVADSDKSKIGTEFCNHTVMSQDELPDFLKKNRIDIGAICTADPEPALNRLVENGIKTIWNLSPKYITVPTDVKIFHANIAAGLLTLAYNTKQ